MNDLRKCSSYPKANPNFIAVILMLIALYFVYIYGFMFLLHPSYAKIGIIITHACLILTLFSLIMVSCTEPGRVPKYFGVFTE